MRASHYELPLFLEDLRLTLVNRIVFWQNTLSIHQCDLIRGIARALPGNVFVVAEYPVEERRRSQGWFQPDFEPAVVYLAPDRDTRLGLLNGDPDTRTVHIFSGLVAYPDTTWTLRQSLNIDCCRVVMAEAPRTTTNTQCIAKWLYYRIICERYNRRIHAFLTMGQAAKRWYRSCGIPSENLISFGYYVDPKTTQNYSVDLDETLFNIVYVGEQSHRKGFDLLLRSVRTLPPHRAALHIVGPTDDPFSNMTSSDQGQRIRFLGAVPNDLVQALIGQMDLLVLPSRFDGWGVVVNEALLAGTPVIVSKHCGAADLVSDPLLGRIFDPKVKNSLEGALITSIREGKINRTRRHLIMHTARSQITAEKKAVFLMNSLESIYRGYIEKQPFASRDRDHTCRDQLRIPATKTPMKLGRHFET